jgi:hypothetical protein
VAKSFKKFREDKWADEDDWSEEYEDDDVSAKEKRMQKRRDRKKMKHNEKFSGFNDKNPD